MIVFQENELLNRSAQPEQWNTRQQGSSKVRAAELRRVTETTEGDQQEEPDQSEVKDLRYGAVGKMKFGQVFFPSEDLPEKKMENGKTGHEGPAGYQEKVHIQYLRVKNKLECAAGGRFCLETEYLVIPAVIDLWGHFRQNGSGIPISVHFQFLKFWASGIFLPHW